MSNDHRPAVPVALEQVLTSLSELETVLGERARPAIAAVQAKLRDAMAARDRGDPVAALQAIGEAMSQLSALAEDLDPQEGALMRALSERFRSALLRGDEAGAKRNMEVMFERSGARERKKRGGK
jgi:hypothetical protein